MSAATSLQSFSEVGHVFNGTPRYQSTALPEGSKLTMATVCPFCEPNAKADFINFRICDECSEKAAQTLENK
jgi:hypothetical protein